MLTGETWEETLMGSMEKFTTRGVSPTRRLDYWNRLCGETLARTCVDSPSRSFRAEMWRWSLGELTMLRPRSEASHVRRSGHTAPDGRAKIVLHFQHHGHSRHRQGQRDVELSPGSFILSAGEEDYAFHLGTEHELLVVELPRAKLEERLPSLDDYLCRCIWGGGASGRIFHDFLLSLWRQGDQSAADPHWQAGISNVFYDMVALAVTGQEPLAAAGRDRQGSQAITSRLLELIDIRLFDAGLSTAMLAAETGVSPRTVQNVFAAMATTPSGFILERRLKRAGDMLRAERERSITSVAFDLGFNDSAYFTRCFRQHFGTTPSQWRNSH